MSIELPPPPVQGADETLSDFQIRHLAWWREGDLMQRVACHNMKAEWLANIEPQFGPTLTRFADAWDALDARLGQLVAALTGQPASTPGAADSGSARVAMTALMTEGGADKPPGEVAQAVLARVAAVNTMLGGEAPASP